MDGQFVAFALKTKASAIERSHPLARDFWPFHACLFLDGMDVPEPSGQYVSF